MHIFIFYANFAPLSPSFFVAPQFYNFGEDILESSFPGSKTYDFDVRIVFHGIFLTLLWYRSLAQ